MSQPALRRPPRTAVLVPVAALTAAGAAVLAPAPASAACHPDPRALQMTFQPVDHTVTDAVYFRARLTLDDRDRRCGLGSSGWAMYFTSVRQPAAVLSGTPGDIGRKQLADQGITVARADKAQSGDFYVLKPTAAFTPVKPGERRQIDVNMELWSLLKTDAPAGWSISYDGGAPHWMPAKALLDPTDPKQTKAFSGDNRPVQDAARRYADNTETKVSLTLKQRILPQPLSATASGGTVSLGGGSDVRAPGNLRGEAGYLRSALGDVTPAKGAPITLRTDPTLDVDHDGKPDAEGYTLTSGASGVEIVGTDAPGVLHGIQTLRQIVPAKAYQDAAAGHAGGAVQVPRAAIADAPLFPYRGMAIDVARHFESGQTVQKFLDLMSFTKLNKLHLRLTDDEGWRIQIPGLPELTGFGARRAFDPDETNALHEGMGSVNDLGGGDGIEGKARNQTQANLGRPPAYQGFEPDVLNFVGKGSGYYSVAEFQTILRYAKARHIEVIPEFDFPAHARAAVQAMERRYKDSGDATYRMLDPGDTSHHVSVQGYTDNMANPCVSGTYRFLSKVVGEVKKIYAGAGAPLGRISLGGDEPPGAPDAWWSGSPACKNNPETAGKDGNALKNLFFGKWNDIARTAAPETSGWEDITDPTTSFRLKGFTPLPWQNVWGWGREDWAYRFANQGTPVILAHATNLYMDLAYNKDPDEPGYYWAEYVDEKSTFTYQPFDVYANATEDRWGNPLTPNPSWTRLTPEGRKNILGLEAQMFGENGMTPQLREYQAFPKLLGAAERAWNRDTPTSARMPAAWNVFTNTLGQVTFPLLSSYRPVGLPGAGVNYRIPLPGGKIDGGTLSANVRDPGLAIEYSTDGVRWTGYSGPVRVGASALTRTRVVDGRTSRISPVDVPGWKSGDSYGQGALVTYQGELFRALRPGSGQAPDVSPASWRLIQ